MRNQKNNTFKAQIPELNRLTSQSSSQINILKSQLRSLTQATAEKRNQLLEINTRLRTQGVKNQKLKKQVTEAQSKVNELITKQVQFLFTKYKHNKQSPLFYNQNGLSPFQLLRIGETKHEEMSQNLICMICYTDLQRGIKIMKLPCTHLVHKQCGIQHFLYSKQCPACNQNLK